MISSVYASDIAAGDIVAMTSLGAGVSIINGGDVGVISIGSASSASDEPENVQAAAASVTMTARTLSNRDRLGL